MSDEVNDLIDRIHSRFRVDVKGPGASDEDIRTLRLEAARTVPDEYVEFVREATDVEILVDGSGYIRIWPPAFCVEMTDAHDLHQYVPGSLPIGDDEGGSILLYLSGPNGEGLYLLGLGDLDPEEAWFVAPSLTDFLVGGVGPTIGT